MNWNEWKNLTDEQRLYQQGIDKLKSVDSYGFPRLKQRSDINETRDISDVVPRSFGNPSNPIDSSGGKAQPDVQGGLLSLIMQAMQGNPQGGLAKQLFGGINNQPQAQLGNAPPQLGLLANLLQGHGGQG